MQRHVEGVNRQPGKSDPLGEDCYELKDRVGNYQIRLLYFREATHLVAVSAFRKDQGKLDPGEVAKAKRARRGWTPADCTGPLSLDSRSVLPEQ